MSWPMSPAAAAALRQTTIRSTFRAQITRRDSTVTFPEPLLVVDGTVDVDATAAFRRRCTVTVVDPTGTIRPARGSDGLAPYGNEIRLWRGITLPDGTTEDAPLGVFGISRAVSSRVQEGGTRVEVEGYDRGRAVARARWDAPYNVPAAGATPARVIRQILDNRRPGTPTRLSITSSATVGPLVFLPGDDADDPWTAIRKMAAAAGAVAYFAPDGTFVARDIPNVDTADPVWAFAPGGLQMLTVENELQADPGYNGVVAYGTTANAPPCSGSVYDQDPTSPTFVGVYGKVPRMYGSPLLRSNGQCAAAAAGLLRTFMGGTEQVRMTATVNPWLDADDVIQATDPETGTEGRYGIEALSIPLGHEGTMTVTTSKRRTAP